jgi:aspartyl protease family protein
MHRLIARLARPVLFLGLALLLLRLATWPLWDQIGSPLRFALACLIVGLLLTALVFAAFTAPGTRHRNMVAWLSVIAAFGAIAVVDRDYDEWQHDRVWSGAPPAISEARPSPPADGEIVLHRQPNGHYYMDAAINGASVNFLVDTGASVLALSAEDARRVGIRTDRLDFAYPVSTAAGQAMAARVIVRRIDVAGHSFERVPALVLRGSRQSLLGMSILERFDSLEIREDRLVLRP